MAESEKEITTTDPLEIDNFIETYQIIAEWIRFADAKAAVVLTAAGALVTLLLPSFKSILDRDAATYPFAWWGVLVVALFLLWAFSVGCSSVWAFMCINPLTRKGQHPAINHSNHFHPAAISVNYAMNETQKFVDDCDELGMAGFKREVIAGILIDSHISSVKYYRVSTSIRLLSLSAAFGLLYALAIQF